MKLNPHAIAQVWSHLCSDSDYRKWPADKQQTMAITIAGLLLLDRIEINRDTVMRNFVLLNEGGDVN
jgi:hypothetical protein